MAKPRLSIELDEELKREVKIKAATQGKKITEVVVHLLRNWIKR